MTTGYQEFPLTESFKNSHPKLLANDKAALTCNAGTAFPDAANTYEGMLCWRTDEKKLYRYSNSAWAVADIQGNAASATKLRANRTIKAGTAVTSTATIFNGTGNITIPITSVKEGYLSWGGQNKSGTFGPLDAALVSRLGANRFAFVKPSAVTIEYSRDGGSTWTDYGASDDTKTAVFTTSTTLTIGGHTSDITVQDQVRITLNTGTASVYTELQKFIIFVSTNGAERCWCSIDIATHGAPSTFVNRVNKQTITGWPGFNIINTPICTYGNSSNQYQYLRFTFGCTGLSTTYPNTFSVLSIYGYGGMGWETPSNLAKIGHLYSYDNNQNATFPATVTATKFVGNAATSSVAGLVTTGDNITNTSGKISITNSNVINALGASNVNTVISYIGGTTV